MTLRYVLKSMRRRKIRTTLMLLALIVGVAILVALNATVDTYERFYLATVSNAAGDYDLVITRKDIEPELLFLPEPLIPVIESIDPDVATIAPRIQGLVDVEASRDDAPITDDPPQPGSSGGSPLFGSAQFLALDPAVDDLGTLQVISGTLDFSPGYAVVLQETADTFDLQPGDTFFISYALPVPRQEGVESASDTSTRRSKTSLTVSAIALQRGVTGEGGNNGVLIDLDYARNWLQLPNLTERIVVAFDERIYNTNDPQAAAFRARAIGENIQAALGESYSYDMPRATILSETFEAFIFFQALVSIYGLLSLSVVGLLVRTMVMTNVREQTRDLALFRILGAPRRYLFLLVIAEVATLGILGIGVGAGLGILLNNLVIVPFIAMQANIAATEVSTVSMSALLLSVGTGIVVLTVSAFAPAQRAASTKIMHAINPGVAEGLGLDDLAKLRERKVNVRIFWGGLIVLFYPALIFFAFPLAFSFGVLWLQATLIFGSLLLLIVGVALLFFPLTLPMDRILIGLIGLVSNKVGYFAGRNITRSKDRNTLISLMIVISATLPTFFATTLAIEVANTPTDTRLSNGTPLTIQTTNSIQVNQGGPGPRDDDDDVSTTQLDNRFTMQLVSDIRGRGVLGPNVAVTYRYDSRIRDAVRLRDVGVSVYGLDGNLGNISYNEGVAWIEGDNTAFDELLADPNAVIISEGLMEYFERGVGSTLYLLGAGLDHERPVRVVGVLGRFSGFNGYTSNRTRAQNGNTSIFINEEAFRELTRDPLDGPYDPNDPIYERIMAAPAQRAGLEGANADEVTTLVATDLRQEFGLTENVTVTSTPEDIVTTQVEGQQVQVVILVLTNLSFVLAIFGVFVVTYISVYSRRSEIAMLKAIGDSNRHLFSMFLGEAVVTTLSATLTGIVAGVLLGYIFRYSNAFRSETPTVLAFDTLVTPYMLILMLVAALVSTLFATWGYLRRRAIEILRLVN